VPYRICKSFEIESGHMLSKHPGACRYPHGHSRRVDVVLAADTLDARDMVCDFKTIKLALHGFLARFDHALAINSADPFLPQLRAAPIPGIAEHLFVFEDTDPTTEVLAERIYRFLAGEIGSGHVYHDARGIAYSFPAGLRLERIRVTETTSSWAEFGEDASR
jgi:6-pyruvoyltetrahydropterin/6-carboxytetrahydropterin synthase